MDGQDKNRDTSCKGKIRNTTRKSLRTLHRVPKKERDGSSGEEEKNFRKNIHEEYEMDLRTSQLQRLRDIKPVSIAFEDFRSPKIITQYC